MNSLSPIASTHFAQADALIRAQLAAMREAFNAHDAHAAASVYTDDADLVTVRGEWFRGREAIGRGLEGVFATRLRAATKRIVSVSVRMVSEELAVAHVLDELSGLLDAKGQELPPHRELSVRAFVAENDTWKVAAFHNTIVLAFDRK